MFLGIFEFHTAWLDAYLFFQQHFHRLAAGSCHRTTPVGVAISDLGVSASNLRHLEARDDGKILIWRTWRTYTSVIVRFEVSFGVLRFPPTHHQGH